MVKTILITLEGIILDTVIGENATLTIGTNVYNGKVIGIIVHEEDVLTTVTLEAKGLRVPP